MLYEIIRTAVNDEKNICYSVFRQNIRIDGINADTYGITAFDITKYDSISDVLTDKSEIMRLLERAVKNSVSVRGLNEFVCRYVDSL